MWVIRTTVFDLKNVFFQLTAFRKGHIYFQSVLKHYLYTLKFGLRGQKLKKSKKT